MTDDTVVDLAFSRYRTSTRSDVAVPPADVVRRIAFRRLRRRTMAASCLAVAATAVSVTVALRGHGGTPTTGTPTTAPPVPVTQAPITPTPAPSTAMPTQTLPTPGESGSPAPSESASGTPTPSDSPGPSRNALYDYKVTGPTTLRMTFDGTRYVGTIQLVGHNVGTRATQQTRLGLQLPGGIQLISTEKEENFGGCASWDGCFSPGIPAGGGQIVYTIKLAAPYARQSTTHSIGQMTLEIHATADGNVNEPDITPDDNSITVDLVVTAG